MNGSGIRNSATLPTKSSPHYTEAPQPYLRDLFATQTGYTTPKVDVRGVVFNRDGALLLVREKQDQGRWTLPGGWADVGDTPAQAVVREIHEEAGYHTRVAKVLAVYDRETQGHPPYLFSAYKLFFRCELLDAQPDSVSHMHETSDASFFHEADLPLTELSLGRVLPSQLLRFFEHYRQPELPTDFD